MLVRRALGPFGTTCIANRHRRPPGQILPFGTAIKRVPAHPVTLRLPCSPENEKAPHGEKDQGQGGTEA